MKYIAQPIVKRIKDSKEGLDYFEDCFLPHEDAHTQSIIKYFPTIYIHNWKEKSFYEVYVGESNDIFHRTRQHYEKSVDANNWQNKLLSNNATLYIIGHEHFNKSLTLDIENKLIHYMMCVDCVKKVHNARGNPQKRYYPVDEFDSIFNKIWEKLRTEDKDLFPSISAIRDTAIFKASPLHKLTDEQETAKNLIIRKVENALANGERGQLVFVDGEAGTGKTVLTSSTFYELFNLYDVDDGEKKQKRINCWLLVNHDEQITVYQQIAEKLGITEKVGQVVSKPTSFINNHSEDEPVDVVFIDEAHLLLTQGKQSYRGDNQLEDVIKRARVTVVMFDENQILSTEQFWEAQILQQYRDLASSSDSLITLNKQLRMNADPETQDWIDAFTKRGELKRIPRDSGYTIKICDTPEELDSLITEKSRDSQSALSRLIATYDWEYSSIREPDDRLLKFWEVKIGDWHKPWNRELNKQLTVKEKKHNKGLSWAEQPQTINEVGSTFTIQGFDLNYAGVILGTSVQYRNGKIVMNPENSCDEKAVRNRTLSDGRKESFGEILIQHEVRVLMTRGVNGMFIYACDPKLRQALKEAAI